MAHVMGISAIGLILKAVESGEVDEISSENILIPPSNTTLSVSASHSDLATSSFLYILQKGDTVLAKHPLFPAGFAPATVEKVTSKSYTVCFYCDMKVSITRAMEERSNSID